MVKNVSFGGVVSFKLTILFQCGDSHGIIFQTFHMSPNFFEDSVQIELMYFLYERLFSF